MRASMFPVVFAILAISFTTVDGFRNPSLSGRFTLRANSASPAFISSNHATSRKTSGYPIVVSSNNAPSLNLFSATRNTQLHAAHMTSSTAATSTSTAPNTISTTANGNNKEQAAGNSLKIGLLFGLWYALNIGYNISNKKLLNLVPNLTYTVAFLQVLIGMVYLLPVWFLGIRSPPNMNMQDIQSLLPIGVLHTLTHLGAVVSLSAGAVSFTHIVKAAEPAVSALFAAVFQKSFMALPVYLSLIPVMGGVAIASATELSFTWLSFVAAMISNIASATRGIFGKSALGNIPAEKNLNAANLYGVMNIMAIVMCLPVCLMLEGSQIIPTVQKLFATGLGNELIKQTLMSGMFYYLYNEVAFLALDNVAPVTHAIGNTIKRVVIILTSVLVFGTKMTTQGMFGSAVAIGGVLLYSLAKSKYQSKK